MAYVTLDVQAIQGMTKEELLEVRTQFENQLSTLRVELDTAWYKDGEPVNRKWYNRQRVRIVECRNTLNEINLWLSKKKLTYWEVFGRICLDTLDRETLHAIEEEAYEIVREMEHRD
jgi:hypothetical protein